MTLFDRNRFCKVAGFINVTALIKRNVIGVNLERHYLQRGNKQRVGFRNIDNLLRLHPVVYSLTHRGESD